MERGSVPPPARARTAPKSVTQDADRPRRVRIPTVRQRLEAVNRQVAISRAALTPAIEHRTDDPELLEHIQQTLTEAEEQLYWILRPTDDGEAYAALDGPAPDTDELDALRE